jgi:hypothetical protein
MDAVGSWSLTRNGHSILGVNEALASYLDPRFRFVVTQIPERVRSRDDALGAGLNCIALAHLVTRELFQYSLPSHMQATELSSDVVHFGLVESTADMITGDLLWFGTDKPVIHLDDFIPRFAADGELLNFDEFPINHVGIYTGERQGAEYLILHASPVDGTNAVWPLSRFADYRRYGTIYKIMRLREQFRAS